MNPEPRPFKDGSEDVVFDVDNRGNAVRIFIGRETVEDFLKRETMTIEERLAFVVRNRQIIEHNVIQYLRHADDVTAIHIHHDLLEGCVTP